MNFIWVGASHAHREFCQTAAQQGRQVQCVDLDEAYALVQQPANNPAWLFIEPEVVRANPDVALALHSHRPAIRLSYVEHVERKPNKSSEPGARICAFEQTDEGMQVLRCCMRESASQAPPAQESQTRERLRVQPVVFEYHAPCR